MNTYKVAVQWMLTCEIDLKAESLAAAIEKAKDFTPFTFLLLKEAPTYIDGSFVVNEDLTAELNGIQGEEG